MITPLPPPPTPTYTSNWLVMRLLDCCLPNMLESWVIFSLSDVFIGLLFGLLVYDG